MRITTVADLTAKQISYSPEINRDPRPTPPQGETTPSVSNPTIVQGSTDPVLSNPTIEQGETTPSMLAVDIQQGETTPTVANPNIQQGETTPSILTPNIIQGSTDPVLPNPMIVQGSTDPILPNPTIIQGSTTPTISNPNINQGSTDPVILTPNIIQGSTDPNILVPNIQQGSTTPTVSNPNIQQGSTDPILSNPNIVQGSTTPTTYNPIINQGQTTPTLPNPNIVQGSTDPILPSPNIIQGSTTPTVSNPNINQGSTTPTTSNPNINQGSTTPIAITPNINQGSTTPTTSNPNINQGSTTPSTLNPNIQQGSTTPSVLNPNINQGSTTPSVLTPNINQGSTTPTTPNPNINQGNTTPTIPNPNIVQGSTTPSVLNPNINQGSTTPTTPNPNIQQGSTTPSVLNPNIQQGSTTPTPPNPNIVQGSTTPTPPNPNIQQGSTTPTPPNPNIIQGSTTPTPSNPNIQQGSTTPSVINPNIQQGSTTPSVITPNINQGSTTPSVINPNIQQGSTTPVAITPNIQQGSTTPIAITPNIQQGSTTPISINPNIQQGATLVNTSPGNWLSPTGGTYSSEQFARNELRLSSIQSVGVLNSIRAAQAVDPLPFTTPLIGETINSLAGFNVPIVGGTSIGPLISSLAGAVGAGGIATIALYMASLPLTLYRRPEGALVIANIGTTIAYNHSRIKRYNNEPSITINTPWESILNNSYGSSDGVYKPNWWEPQFETSVGSGYDPSFKEFVEKFKTVGENSTTADEFIPYTSNGKESANRNARSLPGPLGTPATARSTDPSSPGGWATLDYDQIAQRAEQSRGLGGTPIPESFSSIIPNVPKPTDTYPGGKRVKYEWLQPSRLAGADQITDTHIVDNMMKYNSFQESTAQGMDDFIKFYFTDLRNGKTFQFRSYIENISDRFNPNWTDVQYIGRPNPLKMYTNTTRDVSLDFIVPALSKQEMKMMYNKLTKLANLTIPTGVGIMQAPMMRFTIGDWFANEVGHITSLTFSVEDNYTWEINVENNFVELPHIIKVSMGIYVIGNQAMETNKYKIFGPNAYSNQYYDETDSDTLANNPTDTTFRDQITPGTSEIGPLSPMQDFGDGIMPTSDWIGGQVYTG